MPASGGRRVRHGGHEHISPPHDSGTSSAVASKEVTDAIYPTSHQPSITTPSSQLPQVHLR